MSQSSKDQVAIEMRPERCGSHTFTEEARGPPQVALMLLRTRLWICTLSEWLVFGKE